MHPSYPYINTLFCPFTYINFCAVLTKYFIYGLAHTIIFMGQLSKVAKKRYGVPVCTINNKPLKFVSEGSRAPFLVVAIYNLPSFD